MSSRSDYLAYLIAQGYTPDRAVLFEEGSGAPVEHYTSAALTEIAPPTWTTPSGYTAANAASDNWYGQIPGCPVSTTAETILIIRRKTDSTLRAAAGFGVDVGTASWRCGAHMPYSDGTIYFDFGGFSSPNRLTWGGYTPTTNIEAWAFRAGTLGSSIWLNGIQKGSQGTAITRSTSTVNILINNGNGAGDTDYSDFLFFAVIPAELSNSVLATFIPHNVLDPGFYSVGSGLKRNPNLNGLGGCGPFVDPLG